MTKSEKFKGINLFDIIFSAVLSLFTTCAYNVYKYHEFVIPGGNAVAFVLETALFFVLFLAFIFVIHIFEAKYNVSVRDIKIFEPNLKGLLKGTILISLCYLPVAIIFYPGVCGWDTINQINDFVTGTKPLPFDWKQGQVEISVFLNDHHPVFDTLIFSFFFYVGRFFGNINIGFFIYSILSMVATSTAISYMICFMNKLKIRIPTPILIIFILINPVIAVYSFSMVKDSVFSIVFVWYFVIFASILLTKKTTKKQLIAFIILSVLLCLTKKLGLYIVIPSNIALLFATVKSDFKWRGYILGALAAPIVMMLIVLPHIIFPMANIYPGGRQERLGPMFQEVARVDIDYPDYYNDDEKRVLSNVIDYENIKTNYIYDCSDGIKDTYNFYATSEDNSAFTQLWIRTGFRKPDSYIKATLGNCGGFYAPVKTIELHRDLTSQTYFKELKNSDATRPVRELYLGVYDFLAGIPGVSFLFDNVFYSFWIPLFAIVRCIKRKKKNEIIFIIPILVTVVLFLASPLSHIRYALPLVYTSPLIFGIGLNLKTRLRRVGAGEGDVAAKGLEEPG